LKGSEASWVWCTVADYLSRKNFIVLDELGYLPFAQSGGQQSPAQRPT
jgi:hypothetical protein